MIKNEAGAEFDKIIAQKVMGLKVCECDHEALRKNTYEAWVLRCKDPMAYHGSPSYIPYGSDGDCNTCHGAYAPALRYSSSITRAWEVVEKLGGVFRMASCGLGHYRVAFSDFIYAGGPSGWDDDVHDPDVTVFVYEEFGPAPLAICRAALRKVERDENL